MTIQAYPTESIDQSNTATNKGWVEVSKGMKVSGYIEGVWGAPEQEAETLRQGGFDQTDFEDALRQVSQRRK
ncbi:hypothetical protein ACFLX9_03135 [Chloroflexota bacterium]